MRPRPALMFRPTEDWHVSEVLDTLAKRTRDEIDRFLRALPPQDRMARIREHVVSSIVAGRADSLMLDARPIGILTFTPENDYHYTTALATERCFQPDCLRISKRYNQDLARRLGTGIRAYSRSDHARTAAWFALLGFRLMGQDGDARIFVFEDSEEPMRARARR